MVTAEAKLADARTRLVRAWPFFARFALEPEYSEDTRTETMATDGLSIFWNRQFVDSVTMDELTGVVAHEGGHIAFGHHLRRGERDPKLWNMATDYVINLLLLESGFKLPDGGLVDQRFANLSAEQVYKLLQQEQRQQQPQAGGGQQGAQSARASRRATPAGEVWDMPGDAATVAGEKARQPGKLAQAVRMAKQRGTVPAGLAQMVAQDRASRVDWREKLADWCQQLAVADYSWQRPQRRYLVDDLVAPAARSRVMGPLCVGIDVSGSVLDDLPRFTGELRALHADLRPEALIVLWHDSAVAKVDVFGPDDELDLKPVGGGGTDFRPVFARIAAEGWNPVGVVMLTDLCGPMGADPGLPVLWVSTRPGMAAAFGEVVDLL